MKIIETYRTGWTLNDIVMVRDKDTAKTTPRLKAVYLCYIAQYGRKPVYVIHSLDTGRVGSFQGTKEELFRLFKKYTPMKVSLTSKVDGFLDRLDPEQRDKNLNDQLDTEYKNTQLKVIDNKE